MKYLIVFLLAMLCLHHTYAQVTISFMPSLNGQSVEGLTTVQVVNSQTTSIKATMKISVADGAGNTVINILTQEISLRPGVNMLNRALLSRSNVEFGGGAAASTLSQTGRFPEGEYEYCYQLIQPSEKVGGTPTIYENCFQHLLQPTTPLLLIDPYDEEEICNTRPGFSWQPPMPVQADMRYRIVVAEVADKQDKAEAIANNRPIINAGNIRQHNIIYPVEVPELQKEHWYAWQVTAYSGRTLITQSEIWTFRVHCEDSIPVNEEDSYRELKTAAEGNFYIAKNQLRFSFQNDYKAGKLEYEVIDLAAPDQIIKKLPRLNAVHGLNKMHINLTNNHSFKDGGQYLLKVKNAGLQELTLRFIYKDGKH